MEATTKPSADQVEREIGELLDQPTFDPPAGFHDKALIADESEHEAAARSLGLNRWQSLSFVILPQAVRRVVPPLLNDFVALQKDVALVSILGPLEAFRVAQIEASSNFEYTPLVAAALLYLSVTIPLARIVERMQRR